MPNIEQHEEKQREKAAREMSRSRFFMVTGGLGKVEIDLQAAT
jgi:hypothetical protein